MDASKSRRRRRTIHYGSFVERNGQDDDRPGERICRSVILPATFKLCPSSKMSSCDNPPGQQDDVMSRMFTVGPCSLRYQAHGVPGRPKYDKTRLCVKCRLNAGSIVIRHAVYCKYGSYIIGWHCDLTDLSTGLETVFSLTFLSNSDDLSTRSSMTAIWIFQGPTDVRRP